MPFAEPAAVGVDWGDPTYLGEGALNRLKGGASSRWACYSGTGESGVTRALASTHDPLARHAQHRFLVAQGVEPHDRDPREGMRFFADPESVVLGLDEETDVEVQVGRLVAAGRNPVHVDVEDGVVERPHVESGFLARFAQRDREGTSAAPAEMSSISLKSMYTLSFRSRLLCCLISSSTLVTPSKFSAKAMILGHLIDTVGRPLPIRGPFVLLLPPS